MGSETANLHHAKFQQPHLIRCGWIWSCPLQVRADVVAAWPCGHGFHSLRCRLSYSSLCFRAQRRQTEHVITYHVCLMGNSILYTSRCSPGSGATTHNPSQQLLHSGSGVSNTRQASAAQNFHVASGQRMESQWLVSEQRANSKH